MKRWQKVIKRGCDILGAGAGIIILSPLFAGIAILIRLTMGRPILFVQRRPGLHARPFLTHKFRTMRDARGAAGILLPDTQRLTRLGRFLRAMSLDELPELYDVFRGDMSLVGPRPLLVEYLNRYTPRQARRHEVKPGITGWAQVNGRQTISFSRRIELDVWYVDHQSLRLDAWILLITIPRVLMAAGVRSGQNVREVDDLPPPASPSENQHENSNFPRDSAASRTN
jgi:lipopolysaccharide/colanic/teichoic acid biosynthesis glycosyltransferase